MIESLQAKGASAISQDLPRDTANDPVTILLVCPPGLAQLSLITAVGAVPRTAVVARAPDIESALAAACELMPDVLLVDAYFFQDTVKELLGHLRAECPEVLRVVLMASPLDRQRLLNDGADYVLEYLSLNQALPQALGMARAKNSRHE